MLTCKQATETLSQAQDRALSLRERWDLRLHLLMCSGCRNFARQMELIRRACRRIGGRA